MKLILVSLFLFAQPVLADESFQGWIQFVSTKTWENGLAATLELQPRYSAEAQNFSVNIIRPSLSYALSESMTFAVGYMSLRNKNLDETENRSWVQIARIDRFDRNTLAVRLRFEQRAWASTIEGGQRLRLMGRYVGAPLYAEWAPLVADEIFYELKPVTNRSQGGLNQNRLYLGFNRKWGQALGLDLSLFHFYLVRNTPLAPQSFLGAMVTVNHGW